MKIYSSLTRTKEDLVPLRAGEIGMYVCGPTVYDDPHIGHARSAYIFDVIRRYLAYRGFVITFVRNVTDVDDKIIDKAKKVSGSQSTAQSLEETTRRVAERYLAEYHEDMDSLGIGRPDREPKATEYIPKMIAFIEKLIERGCAYATGGDVYFDIKKAVRYGKLSNQNTEKMESGARISPGEKKKDPLDFALWKSAKEGEPSWESPWGRGRPGWHIECSVMSSDILGGEFDIHGGGIDLIFPHHENEIAQSEGAGERFARYWIHNGLLTINGEKMAKSLGNFITIKDFLAQNRDPDYLKLLFLNTHYRHPVDYTADKIAEMRAQKERFVICVEKIDRILKAQGSNLKAQANDELRTKFEAAMDDDFNTPLALAALFDIVSHANRFMQGRESFSDDEAAYLAGARQLISGLASVFGLNLSQLIAKKDVDEGEVRRLVDRRNAARRAKDFKEADSIRMSLLEEYGIIIEDTKDGTVWRKKV
jgi:cysteinyl-tRNA synthetase